MSNNSQVTPIWDPSSIPMSPMDPFAMDESHPSTRTDPVSGCKPEVKSRAPTNNNENTERRNRKATARNKGRRTFEEELAAEVCRDFVAMEGEAEDAPLVKRQWLAPELYIDPRVLFTALAALISTLVLVFLGD